MVIPEVAINMLNSFRRMETLLERIAVALEARVEADVYELLGESERPD